MDVSKMRWMQGKKNNEIDPTWINTQNKKGRGKRE